LCWKKCALNSKEHGTTDWKPTAVLKQKNNSLERGLGKKWVPVKLAYYFGSDKRNNYVLSPWNERAMKIAMPLFCNLLKTEP
jgi:hypothetical protein